MIQTRKRNDKSRHPSTRPVIRLMAGEYDDGLQVMENTQNLTPSLVSPPQATTFGQNPINVSTDTLVHLPTHSTERLRRDGPRLETPWRRGESPAPNNSTTASVDGVSARPPAHLRERLKRNPQYWDREDTLDHLDRTIAQFGGSTVALERLPCRMQAAKLSTPSTTQEAIEDLTKRNGSLIQEVEFLKAYREAYTRINQATTDVLHVLHKTCDDAACQVAMATEALMDYTRNNADDGYDEIEAF